MSSCLGLCKYLGYRYVCGQVGTCGLGVCFLSDDPGKKFKRKITCVNMVNKLPGYNIMTILTSKQNEIMIFYH